MLIKIKLFLIKKEQFFCVTSHIMLLYKNIYEMSEQIPVICMEMPYNKQVEGKQIIRCHDWKDVYTAIQLFMKKEK